MGTARLKFPSHRGDSVRIHLGYNGSLQLAFAGYASVTSASRPVVITCEDEMFMLKQMPARKKAYRSVTIETLLKGQWA